jgi:glyoxylase-like metal-dependent hydrolase (beta-lactamase superfamily II)
VGTGVRKIILLTLGWEELPKSVSVFGADPSLRMREPVPGVLLQTDGGYVLLDTGFNTALIRDSQLYRRYFPDPSYTPILPDGPGEPLEQALEDVGIDIDEIHAVGISHLHFDHSGGLKFFAGRVPVHMQRREYDFGMGRDPDPEAHAFARVDYDDPRIDWRLADGEVEIAPGVTAIPAYGHTPGNQAFRVDLDDSVGGGGFIFACDTADLTENIEDELAIGGYVGVDPLETVEPIRHLKKLSAEYGYEIIPGHDPDVWPAMTERFAKQFAEQTK